MFNVNSDNTNSIHIAEGHNWTYSYAFILLYSYIFTLFFKFDIILKLQTTV